MWRTTTTSGSSEPQADASASLDNNLADDGVSPNLDDDEPDSSSTAIHVNDTKKDILHGRLGCSEPDLPPYADHMLEDADLEEEKKQTEDMVAAAKDLALKAVEQHQQEQKTQKPQPAVIEDDDGRDHSQPPDENGDAAALANPWQPQDVQSTCEFTHTITNYSQKRESGCKKAEYSATTVDNFGNRWRLIVYVNGNGRASNHHLSLFLQVADADDLPFGWKKAVSYVLTLEHPSGANLSYAKRNPDKTFKLCPKAIDWGWSQFITSDRIQQEGFVSNDSLTVRASVTVKSSSVNIDLDDAELYLKCAVEEGNAEAVKLCLLQGAGVSCKFKDDLYTPLHTACSSGTNAGSMDVLNLLLDRGADGNAYNKWRETPLLIAANNGHRSAVEALLKSGADPSLCSEAGWSALTFAAHKGYDDIVALLLRAGAPVNCRVTEDSSTPLHKACAGSKPGHLSAVKQLLDANADVHALNKWRETPLLTAANHGQAGAVDALLKAGADPCKCTDTGWSPLSIAAYKGHDDVVALLLEEGAPTEEADPTLSALLQAATKGLPDTVELLLRHGADHTVTTKKGDTALSILVEQNLIDAAVEMVTTYKASVPRCSRDRKKVQRARLLINLRMKQQQREGHLNVSSADEGESDDNSDGSNSAQHDENGSPKAATPGSGKKKKKKRGKANISAEEQARAAEEALLLELEQEDAKARKEEAEANTKRAKKKKKKERERQLKLKEERERREREEMEERERARRQKEKEDRERKVREQKAREQREREMREAAEREKVLKKKEREEKEKERLEKAKRLKDLEPKQREKEKMERKNASNPPPGLTSSEKKGKGVKVRGGKKQVANQAVATALSLPKAVSRSVGAGSVAVRGTVRTRDRGWETKAPLPTEAAPNPATESRRNGAVHPLPPPLGMPSHAKHEDAPGPVVAPRSSSHGSGGAPSSEFPGFEAGSVTPLDTPSLSKPTVALVGGIGALPPPTPPKSFSSPLTSTRANNIAIDAGSIELPEVALYRQEKVSELLQRCAVAISQPASSQSSPLAVVDAPTIRKVLYRWIVRATHGRVAYNDCIIPSWVDSDHLATFFHRQFISEGRKGIHMSSSASPVVSMEALRDAGSAMATLCDSLANEVAQFRQNVEDQVPADWSDSSLGVTAKEAMVNGGHTVVIVTWANRAQVTFPHSVFTKLRDQYVGNPSRLFTALFVAKVRYDTRRSIVMNSDMGYRLPPSTQACLAAEAAVSVEVWSDPFSSRSGNLFCGCFEDVDAAFGGLPPFAREEGGGDDVLARRGGSVAVLPPLDPKVASLYVHRMVDMLENADAERIPLSFAVFLQAGCFSSTNGSPTTADLQLLDTRLREGGSSHLRHAEALPAGYHTFHLGDGEGVAEVSITGSLFVLLQSDAGRSRFNVTEASISKIVQSMGQSFASVESLPMLQPVTVPYPADQTEKPGVPPYLDAGPISPHNERGRPDFGAIGGAALPTGFSPGARRGLRHCRLFDLVDDGEEEPPPEDVALSGMLNLNVGDLFQNNVSQDVDIEAISLMGIGSAPGGFHTSGSRTTSRFG